MKKVCLVFPGQGSQYVGMGHDVYQHYITTKNILEEISQNASRNMQHILFNSTEGDLQNTYNSQVAIMSTSAMLYSALIEEHSNDIFSDNMLKVTCVAGHSLGEYSALYVAGAISLEQTAKLLEKRSSLMAMGNANAGMMAVIGGEVELINEIIKEVKAKRSDLVLEVANYNSIGQVVISGHLEAIESFLEIAKNTNIKKCVKLNVSNAFHSSLMKEVQHNMQEIINLEHFNEPYIPIIQNYTAQSTSNIHQIKENLVMQISNQVKWVETVQNAIANGVELFIEIGPKNVLTGLIKRIDVNVKTMNIEKLDDIRNFQENIKKLFI